MNPELYMIALVGVLAALYFLVPLVLGYRNSNGSGEDAQRPSAQVGSV